MRCGAEGIGSRAPADLKGFVISGCGGERGYRLLTLHQDKRCLAARV